VPFNIKIIRLSSIFVLPWNRLHIKDIFVNIVFRSITQKPLKVSQPNLLHLLRKKT